MTTHRHSLLSVSPNIWYISSIFFIENCFLCVGRGNLLFCYFWKTSKVRFVNKLTGLYTWWIALFFISIKLLKVHVFINRLWQLYNKDSVYQRYYTIRIVTSFFIYNTYIIHWEILIEISSTNSKWKKKTFSGKSSNIEFEIPQEPISRQIVSLRLSLSKSEDKFKNLVLFFKKL